MKNLDLEDFYKKINGHILLTTAYMQNAHLYKIIKSCRLKPYSVFTKSLSPTTKLEKHWVDEFGNSLKFIDGILPKIISQDVSLSPNTKSCTDLFYGNSVKSIGSKSKFALIADGIDLLLGKDILILAFYGQDEYLRSFVHTNNEWMNISPLMLGMNTLNEIFKSLNIAYINELDNKKLDIIIPLKINKGITTSWPPKQNIISCFDNEQLINIL